MFVMQQKKSIDWTGCVIPEQKPLMVGGLVTSIKGLIYGMS